jgi:hypothetical protein
MPAIQPARLRQQAVDLAATFDQPALFVRELQTLLDWYTDYSHRKARPGGQYPLVNSYKAHPQVMRYIWLELIPLINGQPDHVLTVCDALWAPSNLDLQLLAARMLGSLPATSPDPIVSRLQAWISPGLSRHLLDGLLQAGLTGLYRDAPEKLLELVSSWLGSADIILQQAGLRALLAMMGQSEVDNLPIVFRLLTPFLRIAPAPLRPDVLAVVSALAQASPSETAFLLRQNLTTPDNPDTPWLIRQVLSDFPRDIRNGLRQALKEKR